MEAAIALTPESLYLEGRNDFFQGRGLLYDKQYRAGRQSARAIRPHRSRRGLRLQRAGHRVSRAGRLRQGHPGIPRRRAARAELVLSAAQPGAGLCGSRRLPGRHPQLSAGHADHPAVQLSALQSRPRLSASEPAPRRRDCLSQGHGAGARFRRAAERARFAEGFRRQVRRSRKVLSRRAAEESRAAHCACRAPQPGPAAGRSEEAARTKPSRSGKQNLAAQSRLSGFAAQPRRAARRKPATRPALSNNTDMWSVSKPEYIGGAQWLWRACI